MKTRMFISGAVAGALVSALIHVVVFRPPHHPPGPPPPGRMEAMLLDQFSEDLSLTGDQRKAIAPILTEMHKSTLALRLSRQDEMEKILDKTDQQISPLLSGEQREKLAKRRARMKEFRHRDERFLGEHDRRPGPPPGLPRD